MNIYYYFAVKRDCTKIIGVKFAENKKDLADILYKLKEYLLFCIVIPKIFIKLKVNDILGILEHIKYQIGSGHNLLQAVSSLLSINNSIKFQYFLTIIYQKLNVGENAASAFQGILGNNELFFIEIMEKYGSLKTSIKYLIRYIEFNNDLKKLLKNKLSYPIFLCVFVLGIFLIYLYYIFPKINCFYSTESNTSTWIFEFLSVFIVLSTYYVIVIKFFKKLLFSDIFCKSLAQDFNTLIFSTTLSIFLSSGIFFVRSIEIMKNMYAKSFFKNYMNDIYDDLQKGVCIYESFYKYKKFFRMDFIEIIKISELNNKMQEMMLKYSEKLYSDINEKITSLTNKLVIYITIIAGIILIVTLSTVLNPIYKFVQDIDNVV